MPRIGVITGLRAEARIVAQAVREIAPDSRPLVEAAGGSAVSAYGAARLIARRGGAGLVSFGIAAGLRPGLAPGDLVLGEAVRDPQGVETPADAAWRGRVADALGGSWPVIGGTVAGCDRALQTAADKAALFAACGAAIADMESHGIARAARETGLPLLVLRVVADPADRAVPEAAVAGMAPDGRSRIAPVVLTLLRHPGQLGGLIAIAADLRRALRVLRGAALSAGPALFRL